MKSSLPAATKAEIERWSYFPVIGCVACRQMGRHALPQAHHQLSGNKRIGHAATIPLCPYHHVGQPPDGMSARQALAVLGPSLALASKQFREAFGSDLQLLHETNRRIEALRSQRVGT